MKRTSKTSLRVFRTNVNGNKTANNLPYRILYGKCVDLVLISEQYQERKSPNQISDIIGIAAILIPDLGRVRMKKYSRRRGFVKVKREMSLFLLLLHTK